MSQKFALHCRAQNGQHALPNVTDCTTVGEMKQKISLATGIGVRALKIFSGYPPGLLNLDDDTQPISSLLKSGDTLTIEENKSFVKIVPTSCDSGLLQQFSNASGILTRKVVPADNSCLFTSIYATLNRGQVGADASSQLRRIIADAVASDVTHFSNAFLGKSNRDYCKWILDSSSWGGAIEISILSAFYGVEIDVVDTQSGRIDRFGEDKMYKDRVLILYDGVHYDPLVFEQCDPSSSIETMFPINNAFILSQAMELADEAKVSRQYTDLASFSLKCLICRVPLTGQKDAQQHAKQTGHVSFGEMI